MVRLNRQWRLAARPRGRIKPSDFAWHEEPVAEPGGSQVLVRNIYLSLDPTNRGWMSETPTYLPPVAIGEVMRGITVGVVEQSRVPELPEGTLVGGMLGWQAYALAGARQVTPLPHDPRIPLTAQLGLLGHIGMTAYFGMLDIARPKAGETLVVSAAAGAVGSLAGQIGKICGCRVVGIAGSDEKCRWICDELGFDAAINYRTEQVPRRLKECCPKGIDIDFENVGGEILEAILGLINLRARVVVCGLISQYNSLLPPQGPMNFGQVLLKRARIEGFIVLDYVPRAAEAISALTGWFLEGRIRYRVQVLEGLEQAAAGVNILFDGGNTGKLLVKVSAEPA
jgi:NADPH-dependent curcumin reductase CurA